MRSTRVRAGATLVALVAAFAATLGIVPRHGAQATAATSAPAVDAADVGIGSHFIWYSEADTRAQLQRLVDGGVRSIREDFRWNLIEPTRGVYDWTRTDRVMAAAAATGVDVLGIVTYTAPWASSDPTGARSPFYPPTNAADYGQFALAVADRYGADGSFWAARPDLVPRPLRALELWNEPYGHWFWKANPDPARYAELVRAAASALAPRHASMTRVASCDLLQARTDGVIMPWIEALLTADPTLDDVVDVWGVHPYPGTRSRGPYDTLDDARFRFERVTRIREITVSRGAARPIWITEVGWSTATSSGQGVDEATQALYFDQTLTRALVEWGSFVERVYLFSWDRSNGVMTDSEGNYGLRRADDSLKPAWTAVTSRLSATTTTTVAPTTTTTAAPTTTTTVAPTTTTTTAPKPPRPRRNQSWSAKSAGWYTLWTVGWSRPSTWWR